MPLELRNGKFARPCDLLVCPHCLQPLATEARRDVLRCSQCKRTYGRHPKLDQWDLRCGVRSTRIEAVTGAIDYRALWSSVQKSPPPLSYRGPAPARTDRGILSAIKENAPPGGWVLDVGCGAGAYRGPVRGLGLSYLGIDYESQGADVMADAHALPIADQSVDAVILPAVTQALEYPQVACLEVARVLKEGGVVAGTADSGATFCSSFFHITPWGVISLLIPCGIAVERIWCQKDALQYFGTNPGYPRLLRLVLRLLSRVSQLRLLTPTLWFQGKARDPFVTVGSMAFVGRKRPLASGVQEERLHPRSASDLAGSAPQGRDLQGPAGSAAEGAP